MGGNVDGGRAFLSCHRALSAPRVIRTPHRPTNIMYRRMLYLPGVGSAILVVILPVFLDEVKGMLCGTV